MRLAVLSEQAAQISDIYAANCAIRRDDDWWLLKLQEELGELTQAHLKVTGRGRTSGETDWNQARADEAADLLCQLLLYCRRFEIDLEQAVERKWLSWLKP
jgi:NTP pyrophosphatase (non-canonical NTP hydrolase)